MDHDRESEIEASWGGWLQCDREFFKRPGAHVAPGQRSRIDRLLLTLRMGTTILSCHPDREPLIAKALTRLDTRRQIRACDLIASLGTAAESATEPEEVLYLSRSVFRPTSAPAGVSSRRPTEAELEVLQGTCTKRERDLGDERFAIQEGIRLRG